MGNCMRGATIVKLVNNEHSFIIRRADFVSRVFYVYFMLTFTNCNFISVIKIVGPHLFLY